MPINGGASQSARVDEETANDGDAGGSINGTDVSSMKSRSGSGVP